MAEALARHLASDVIEATSAGLAPFGEIVAPTREALAEIGVGVDGQFSKPVRPEDLESADLIVNLTGRPSIAIFQSSTVAQWKIGRCPTHLGRTWMCTGGSAMKLRCGCATWPTGYGRNTKGAATTRPIER